jgi:hypothetical protein
MYMEWYVRHAQVGTTIEAVYTRELAGRYGTRMTQEQWDGFFADNFPEVIAELEYHISRDPIFAEMGIYTYVDFMQAHQADEFDDEIWQILNRLASPENDRVSSRLFTLWQMQSARDNWPFQIDMDGEFERYGYNEWFSQTLATVLESGNVPVLLEELRKPLIHRADEFIASYPLFAENDVATYEQFAEIWNDNTFISFEHERIRWLLWFTMLGPEADFVERKIGVLDEIESRYAESPTREIFVWQITDWMDAYARRLSEMTPSAQRRIDSIIENSEYLNIMYYGTFWTTTNYIGQFTLLAVLAVLALILPLVTVDRMRNLQSLQYSAKLGRRILYRQVAAMLLSSFLLTTLLLVFFGGIYFYETGVLMYWSHNVYSVSNQSVLLFDFTFGLYLIMLTAMAYIVTLGAALLAFVVSSFSRSLISATIKIIPVFIVLAFFIHQLNNSGAPVPFSAGHRFYLWTKIVGVEMIACAVLLVLSLGLAFWAMNRDKRIDMA